MIIQRRLFKFSKLYRFFLKLNNIRIDKMCNIQFSIRGNKLFIGKGSVVDSFVKIKFVGGNEDIRIGSNVYINSNTTIYSGNGVTIGDGVLIGPGTMIVPANHEFNKSDIPIAKQGFKKSKGGIVNEDNVWVGAGTTILDGSYIESNCVIGANSLVKGHLYSGNQYAGNPLKRLNR